MNQKIVQQVTDNSLISQEIFRSFLKKINEPMSFLKCFHLRPTSNGVTIVSTLPYAAMRGVSIKCSELGTKLDILSEHFNKLVGVDEYQAKQLLHDLGFQQRLRKYKSIDFALEEDIQAHFIRGMLDNQAYYDGIQFVASELNLEDSNRFDVIGIKDNCVYIFELKKGRTTAIFEQIGRYIEHFNQYGDEFSSLIQSYPNLRLPNIKINEVKGIAVMRYAENSSSTKWESLIMQHQIDVWFYKEAISFYKLTTQK